MQEFKVSEATAAYRRFYLFLVDLTDGHTPETGEAGGQPQISKNGAGFTNTTAVLVHVGRGQYYVELTAAELDTLGYIQIAYNSANVREFPGQGHVVAYNPHSATDLGLSYLTVLGAAIAEPTTTISATPTPVQLWGLQVQLLRNMLKATATEIKAHNDAGVAIAKYTITDDGTTFTRNKQAAP
jgi:hypothetical protein